MFFSVRNSESCKKRILWRTGNAAPPPPRNRAVCRPEDPPDPSARRGRPPLRFDFLERSFRRNRRLRVFRRGIRQNPWTSPGVCEVWSGVSGECFRWCWLCEGSVLGGVFFCVDVWQLHEFGGIEAPGFFRKCGNLVVSEGGIGRFGKGVIHRIFLLNVSFISSNLNTGKKLNIHH